MKMPFGKHRGKELSSIPDDYLYWLLSLDDIRKPLKMAVEDEIERRKAPDPFYKPEEIEYFIEEIVERGFRASCAKYHPDKGGNGDDMRILIDARDWLRECLQLKRGK